MVEVAEIDLDLLGERIRERTGVRGTCTVTHPAELNRLRGLTMDELREFTRRHGLRVNPRMNRRIFEFNRAAVSQYEEV